MKIVERGQPQAPRNFLDKLFHAWFTSMETLWIGASITLAFQLVVTVISQPGQMFPSFWIWATVTGAQFLFMLLRRCSSLLALAGQTAVLVSVDLAYGVGVYSWIPFLYCLGSLVLRASRSHIALGIGCAVAATLIIVAGFEGTDDIGIPALLNLAVVVMFAALLRARWNLLISKDERLEAEQKEHIASQRQREAEAISRVATNLHDSVGHNLTGIITLTEGIAGHTDSEETDEVVALVNALAREALEETRYAVRAIKPVGDEAMRLGPPDAMHTWSDIATLIHNVRATGLRVLITEHGQRTEDQIAQELAFLTIRESLTNVMRHARDATVAVIALTFSRDLLEVSVRDNGKDAGQTGAEGTGLKGLTSRLEQAGGTLKAGWDDNEWRVDATIPIGTGRA